MYSYDDDGVSGLSKVAGLRLGLADVKAAFHRFKISTLYSSFFAPPEVCSVKRSWPILPDPCARASAASRWSTQGASFSPRTRWQKRRAPRWDLRVLKLSKTRAAASSRDT